MNTRFSAGRFSAQKISLACFALAATGLAISCGLQTPGQDVAATVDGEKIYNADVEKYFQRQTAGSSQPTTDEQATSMRLSILHELIENQILMHRAGKLGLLATDDEVDRKLKEVKSPYTDQEFSQKLQERKVTVDDFKREIRRALTADKVFHKEVSSKISITQQDIAEYYNQHRAEYNLIEPRYHLGHIVVTGAPDPQSRDANKARNLAEAQKKIQTVLARLEAGDDFSSLAMTYSEDSTTAANGGDVGIVPESALKQTDPLTRESVMKLKPGQHTPIIPLGNPATKQIGGFQIVKLISVEAAGQRDVSDPKVEQEIRTKLQEHREQLLKAAYYEVMSEQAKVENFYAERVLAGGGTPR